MALPNIEPTVNSGGPLINAMRNISSLTDNLYGNEIKRVEAQYAPLTRQAEAASKLAYANLMGPQFLAKLMGNDSALANMSEDQKRNALQKLYRAGSGEGTGNELIMPSSETVSPLPQNPMAFNNQENISSRDKQRINAMQPGESYKIEGNNSPEIMQSPSLMKVDENISLPSYAENTGKYQGIVEEGKESGKIRAKDIDELNTTYFNGQTNQSTLDNLSKILSSPEFEQIRQVPIAGQHELSYYAKFGTPAQQNMVGQYYTLTGNIVKDSARDFAGAFRKGEQQLLQGMKPSPSDTVDTARGKTESLAIMNKMLTERSRLTSHYMTKNHINKLQAQEIADKQIDGNAIRHEIHDKLNPVVTIENKKTGEKITVPISEARQKYGVSPDV